MTKDRRPEREPTDDSQPGTHMTDERNQGRDASTNSVLTITKPGRDRDPSGKARATGTGDAGADTASTADVGAGDARTDGGDADGTGTDEATVPSSFEGEGVSLDRSDEGVVTIELDADVEFCWEFRSGLRQACRVASEIEPGAIVLTGEPGAFAMGGDGEAVDDIESTYGAKDELGATFEAVATRGVPVVAATRGPVRGFGLALALCADIRIGGQDSTYGCPIVPPAHLETVGATKRLAATVGRDRAAEFLLSGTTYDAERMADWGLLNEVASDETAVDRAQSLAETFAGRQTVVYKYMKHAVRAATTPAGGDADDGSSGLPRRSDGIPT